MEDNFIIILIFNILTLSVLVFYFIKNSNKGEEIKLEDKLKQLIQQVSIENNETLRQSNVAELNKTLDPFKEQLYRELKILKENIDSQKKQSTEEFSKFEVEFKNLVATTKEMDEAADNLTKALKGDTKKQGDWGERILEKAFEDAGLVEGLEYHLQPNYKTKEGENQRPDAVVHFTDKRDLIIDSKVSIKAYVDYVNSEETEEKEKFLKDHIRSIKKHIKELSDKDYPSLEDINSPDYVYMFVPNDSALQAALTNDWSIQELANEKRIGLLSPIHLMSVLKMTAYMWRVDKQNKNALKIAERAGLLMDKYVNFVEDFSKIAIKLNEASESYDEAAKKLTDGTGNLHSQIQLLEEQGMKGKKDIPDPGKVLEKK